MKETTGERSATPQSVKKIAIIGGGPTGIAFARYFLAEKAFDTIHVFEQRDNVGGIWNLSKPEHSSRIPIPQTDPKYGTEDKDKAASMSLEFESPLYDYLETNIPKPLMAYSDTPFDPALPLFPGHADVLRYLEEYAAPVRHLIYFNTQVIGLSPEGLLETPVRQKWRITTKALSTGTVKQTQYDAIVVANGHYTIPHVPDVPGLANWHHRYSGTVIHSKAYRRPEDFKDQKVLVIGNSASGLDIAAQLASCAHHPVHLASRSASQLAPKGGGPSWRKDITEVEEFLDHGYDRAVRTKSGEIVGPFDAVIFATGYFYAFPFVSEAAESSTSSSNVNSPSASTASLDSDEHLQKDNEASSSSTSSKLTESTSESLKRLTTSGLRTHDVYKHFLHIDYPTLALPVLNLKIIPFPLAENQAAVVARLWSGRLDTPSGDSMRAWEKEEEARLLKANRLRPAPDTASGESVTSSQSDGISTESKYEGGFHTLVYPEDANQINSLHAWAASARDSADLENNGKGKLGTGWGEYQVWLRGQFPDIKAAYAKRGENRTEVTSLDGLGDDWKYGFQNWQKNTPREEQEELFRKAGVLCK